MVTIIPPGLDRGRRAVARWLTAALATSALLTISFSYIRSSVAIATVDTTRLTPKSPPALERMTEVSRAIVARPLRQSLLSAAVIFGNHATDNRWIAVMRRMGWRSTIALQIILQRLIAHDDLDGTLETLDALLRRGQLFTESSLAIGKLELFPAGRPYVVRLLARRPPWRHDYLVLAGDLKDRESALGRYQVLLALQQGGEHLARDEIAPLLPVLIRVGSADAAWHLWQRSVGATSLTSPLNDSNFRIAAHSSDSDEMSVPFEWHMGTGQGFSAEPYLDQGIPRLAISWDGRGVPVFASQRTSAPRGILQLDAISEDAPATVERLATFRLRCDDGSVISFRRAGFAGPKTLRYLTEAPVECMFPVLEIAGQLQANASSLGINLDGIVLSAGRN